MESRETRWNLSSTLSKVLEDAAIKLAEGGLDFPSGLSPRLGKWYFPPLDRPPRVPKGVETSNLGERILDGLLLSGLHTLSIYSFLQMGPPRVEAEGRQGLKSRMRWVTASSF